MAEKGHSVTGVYYSSAGLQYPNYHKLLIPGLYAVIIFILLQRRATL